MSYNLVDPTTGDLTLVAGSTLYADLAIGDIVSSGRAADNPAPGFFYCDGRALSRTAYAELFNAIGTSFGSGDGSTTFNIPDMRGEFIRGAGTNSHTNQGNGGTVGQHQDGTEHVGVNVYSSRTGIYVGSSADAANPTKVRKSDYETPGGSSANAYRTTATAQAGTESTYSGFYTSRPTNTSVNFFIKAEQVAVPTDFMSKVDEVYGPLIPSNASPANKLVTASDNNFTYKKLTANTDFNTLTTPGLYAVGTDDISVSHAPIVGTFSLIVSNVADGWVQQLAIFNGDGRTFVRISIPGNWGIWDEVSFLNKVVQKFDTDVTPTSGVTGLYNVTVDCLTQFVPILRAKGVGSYSGLLTCASAWSGQYSALVYDALVVIHGNYRFGNDIYTFTAVHNGVDLKIYVDAPEEGTATANTAVIDTSQYNAFSWKRRGKYVVASAYIGATKSIGPSSGNTVLATGFPVPFGFATSMVPVSWATYNATFTVQIDQTGQLVIYTRGDIPSAQVYSGQCAITYECV